MGWLGDLIEDVLEIPEKVIEKTIELPGKVIEKVIEEVEDLPEKL